MIKFFILVLSSVAFYTFAYFSVHSLHQRYFEKRIPTKKGEKSLFYGDVVRRSNTTDVKPMSNQDFKYKFEYLDIDNTNLLDLSLYACQPISFGYSQKDGKKVFPYFKYPDCSKKTHVKFSRLSIDRNSNTLTLNCEENEQGYFYSGPIQGMSLMRKKDTFKIPLKYYNNSQNAESIEFALGSCEPSKNQRLLKRKKNKPSNFQHASMSPIFNETLFNQRIKQVITRPKIIFLLTLDSFSRRHFYRKLPSVVNYLNNSEKIIPNIALYDLQLHSTFSSDSVHNQVPIFAGKDYKKIRGIKKGELLGNYAMWNVFKRNGFVTVMGFDDCDKWFPNVIGDNPNVDYSIRQFYCLVDQHTKIRTDCRLPLNKAHGPYSKVFSFSI